MYSVTLGFVIGQIGQMTTSPPRQPPAIVRTRTTDIDPQGFAARERVSSGTVLTMPLELRSDMDHQISADAGSPERAWIRNN